MSQKGQMSVTNLSGFAIALLVVGIVVVVAFLITGSFQTTLIKNGEDTPTINASMVDTNNAFGIIQNLPPVIIGIVLFLISAIIFLRFRGNGREEEVRD
jgi:heme/copper-type cytochrome/quinol oxidase subunit 2